MNSTAPTSNIPMCPECGNTTFIEEIQRQEFPYKRAAAMVTLTAEFPVSTCTECGTAFFDERGEDARHAAICEFERVHKPDQVRAIRDRAGLTREDWSNLSGHGIASQQRWESGGCIPNQSSARLLHLMQYPENLERLRQFAQLGPTVMAQVIVIDRNTQFQAPCRTLRIHPRVDDSPNVQNASRRFVLRKTR